MKPDTEIIDLNADLDEVSTETSAELQDAADIAQEEAAAVRSISSEAQQPQQPLPPPLQPVVMLQPNGFVLGFVPRVPEGETRDVPIVSSIIYQDLSLAVTELEAMCRAARQAELQVATQQAYGQGVLDGEKKATSAVN